MFQLANSFFPPGALGENPEKVLSTQGKDVKHQACRTDQHDCRVFLAEEPQQRATAF